MALDTRPFMLGLLMFAVGAGGTAYGQPSDPVPATRRVEVEWPSAEAGKAAFKTLTEKSKAAFGGPAPDIDPGALEATRLPVLVPEKALGLESFSVRPVRGGDQYFATGKSTGAKVVIVGSRVVTEPPAQSPSSSSFAAPSRDKYKVTRTETGLLLGFNRYGVPYTISIECEKRSDERCRRETYIRSLADSMTFIGGQP